MRKSLLLVALASCFLLPVTGFSQLLNGRVLNEEGRAAAGVTVNFRNKANKILTNIDGSFKIMATSLPDTLTFSAPGFEPYNVVITEKNIRDPKFEVVLLNARKELSEVVVTAYSTSMKREVTGSVSSISSSDLALEERASVFAHGYRESSPGIKLRGSSYTPVKSDSYVEIAAGKGYFFLDSVTPREGALAKSRILTAGEVNDFNKWKMWEDYTDNEFRTFSEYWGIKSNKRYSVQLTNKTHDAVINEPVYLITKASDDTVWKAYTDNTGKAELWASFFNDGPANDEYYISDRQGNRMNNPTLFSSGINMLVADKACNVSNEVDIAFVVDATGSMGDEIEFLKLELEDVIRSTMDKYSSLTLNAASVFYRDRGDQYLAKNVAFNDDLLKTINFIKLQQAGGGGDNPEAVDDALSMALDSLHWHNGTRTKLLFLVLDAPPHDYARERIRKQILQAAAMGIRIIPIACSGADKSTEFLLRSMALATNGTYTFLTNHSGVGKSHIEPTTDKYEVELLNNLLQRLIGQFLYAKDCNKQETDQIQQQDIHQPGNIFSVKIYPNPTSGQFTIESKKDIRDIFVTDFTGKILMRLADPGKKGRWKVDIGRYPSGFYLVKYITADNKWGAEKVILAR